MEIKICTDCNRVIDGVKIKGMKCKQCGRWVCYKCNITYCCKDCYSSVVRGEYYNDTPIIQNV